MRASGARDAVQPAPSRSPRRPALARLPLLAIGFVALAAGTGAGLARLGWPMPVAVAGVAAWHGPLMICGFLGLVIALERAVAIGRRWAYAGPLCALLGSAALLHGEPQWAPWGFLAASLVLLAATLSVWARQREDFVVVLTLAAACWAAGNGLWAAGGNVPAAVPWWIAFLVLTIAGERLELSRFMRPARMARRAFALVTALLLLSLASIALVPVGGPRAFGGLLLALALWLLRHDIARRTVRQHGLTRFIAVCLLSGYVALALGGAIILVAGLPAAGAVRDAALHSLLLGFVFAMIFGHAPIVFPSVLRVALPYHPVFYGPLLLLQASLMLRLLGHATGMPVLVRWGGLGSALALLLFVVTLAQAVWRGRPARFGAEVAR